jgi:hypothetical protein
MRPAVFTLITILALAGCATPGNGQTDLPPTPTLSVAVAGIKTVAFTWNGVDGATAYILKEDPTGDGGYTTIASLPADAWTYDLQLFLPARVNARYTLSACNAAGCSESDGVAIEGLLTALIGYVKAANTGAGGQAVAVSADGNTLAVGAPYEGSTNSGAVYLYTRDSAGAWIHQAYIKPTHTDAFDLFGLSIALSADGHTLAVGAPYEDSNATGIGGNQTNNNAEVSGAVYLYARDNAAIWTHQAYIKATNTDVGDLFGNAVALSGDGNTLAVGAPGEDSNATGIGGDATNNTALDSGAVYLYTRNSAGAWTHQAYIKATNTDFFDRFGHSIALSADGNTLAAGAYLEDSSATGIGGNQTSNTAFDTGAVYLYTRNSAGTWTHQAYIKATNTDIGDIFGWSVALSAGGTTLAVGAPYESSGVTGIGGNQNDNTAVNSGAVYLYSRDGAGAWTPQAYIKATNTGTVDEFGWSIALSADGNTLAVGAPYEDSNATGIGGDATNNTALDSGAVYLYTRTTNAAWSHKAYIKATNTGARDEFGRAVALSTDGQILAVGAPLEDSNASGIGGNQNDNTATDSGAVYLY